MKLQLIMQLPVVAGSYMFSLPLAFFPNYSRLGAKKNELVYDFRYEVKLQTREKVTWLSIPDSAFIVN